MMSGQMKSMTTRKAHAHCMKIRTWLGHKQSVQDDERIWRGLVFRSMCMQGVI